MSFPLPSFDSKHSHRPKLFDTSIQEFNWNELSDKDVIGSGSFGSVITAKCNGKTSLQCRRILGARVHIFILGHHLGFSNSGGLGEELFAEGVPGSCQSTIKFHKIHIFSPPCNILYIYHFPALG